MKKEFLLLFFMLAITVIISAEAYPDFTVKEITIQPNKFIYIKLRNLSQQKVDIKPELREKIFLVIYINNIKRAEYKLKYINPILFTKDGEVILKTNFRFTSPILIKVNINPGKIIPESNYLNNSLSNQLKMNG